MEVWMGTSAIKGGFSIAFSIAMFDKLGVLPCCHVPCCPCVAWGLQSQTGWVLEVWASHILPRLGVRWTAIAVVCCCGRCSAKCAMLWAPWFFHNREPCVMVGPILYGLAWLNTQVLRSYGFDVCVSTFKLDWHPGIRGFHSPGYENHLKCEVLGQEQ